MRGSDILRKIDRRAGSLILYVFSLFKRRRAQPEVISTIILVCIGAVGDLLLSAAPAIDNLRHRYPDARIVLVTSKLNRDLTNLLPACDVLVDFDVYNPLASVRMINQFKADLAIDFTQWLRITGLVLAFSNAKFSVGFETPYQNRHYCYDLTVPHRNSLHEAGNFASLLRAAGIPGEGKPALRIPQASIGRMETYGLNRYIVLHLWAAGTRHEMREWPSDNWHALIGALLGFGYEIALTGGPADGEGTAAFLSASRASQTKIHNFAGQLRLAETAALLSRACAVVSVNTGIMHMAAALGVPLVALNGPTDPRRWGPVSDRAISLVPEAGRAGYLNLGFEYPAGIEPCMQYIRVRTVIEAVTLLLEREHVQQELGEPAA